MAQNTQSIRTRFTSGLIGAISILIFLFSCVFIGYGIKAVETQLQKQLNTINSFSQKSLSIALWQYNYDYIENYLESLFLYEDVVYAGVLDGVLSSSTLITQKTVPDFHGKTLEFFLNSDRYITSEISLGYNDEEIGVLQVVLSRSRVMKLVLVVAVASIFVLILVNLAIFGITYSLSSRYLFRPLRKLENSVKSIAAGNMHHPIDASDKGEIGQLAISFQHMMENLQKMTASRDELNQEVSARKKSEQRISRLNDLNERLLGKESFGNKAVMITQSVVELLYADFCRIWLLQEGDLCTSSCLFKQTCYGDMPVTKKTRCLQLVASSGRYTHVDGVHARVPLGSYKIGQIGSGDLKSFITNDVTSDERIHDRKWAEELGLVSFCGVRLQGLEAETVGVIAMFSQHALPANDQELFHNLAATASDVIQTKLAEEELLVSEKKFRNFFINAEVGMFRANLSDGLMIEANEQMATIFGYDTIAACVELCSLTRHFVELADSPDIFTKSLTQKGSFSGQNFEIKTHNGEKKWIDFSAVIAQSQVHFEGVVIDVTEKKLAEEQLKESLAEKEILFKEVHHRVKNNMQIIQSLLSLQSSQVKDDYYAKLLVDSNNRIKSMALIHEILYQADDIANFDLKSYFERIIANLDRIYRLPDTIISTKITVLSVNLDIDLAIACGLILNELVTNSFKYGFANRSTGQLSVTLTKQGSQFCFIISDDGPGLSDKQDLLTSDSLGLKIVRLLVQGQLKGSISVKQSPGMTIEISFGDRSSALDYQ